MVLIMVTAWIPPDKIAEAAEKYMQVIQKYPQAPFEKPLVEAASRSTKDGIEVVSIGEIERGKYEEALELALKRNAEYYSIKGYRYRVDTLAKLEEALPTIGMTPP